MAIPSLEISLTRFAAGGPTKKLRELARYAEATLPEQGAREVSQHILDTIGVSVSMTLNDSYCTEMVNYYLGLVQAALRNHEKAAQYLHNSSVLPTGSENLIFSDQVRIGMEIHQHQQRAFQRGMPGIIVSSMPRSASGFLTQTIASLLDIPVVRVSAGIFPHYGVVPGWLNHFTPGGGVLHDHFGASDYNLRVLRESGVREVFVLARDPRASALSSAEYTRQTVSAEQIDVTMYGILRHRLMPWLRGWVTAERQQANWLKVHWLSSQAVRADIADALAPMFDRLRPVYPALPKPGELTIPEISANRKFGDDTRWKSIVPLYLQPILWQEIGDEVAERLGFQRD